MNAVQILFGFSSGLWSRYASADALLDTYNAAQVDPEPEEGQEQVVLALSDTERAIIGRAIATEGKSYPIDLERIAAMRAGETALKFYQGKGDGVVTDGDTLAERGADLGAYEEAIATESAWHNVSFVRQHMDSEILAELDALKWPGFLLLLKLYRVLHQQKLGASFSLSTIAAAIAAESAAKAEEKARREAASKVDPATGE